ncbi:two-component sensor histidine kinase [Pseudolysobacter antarcticus]|uniref:histidine kinase n=1 Tax=Pseudolysobacter antarcticus TaxID=2511995 RepID=A0A411HM18_9GAMM|nr:ATP-binding protein [Pseudolysobacter antarcticus]QBB71538.1 two-component sensor histidine kinase [Pseudolysobacter antarcticus]
MKSIRHQLLTRLLTGLAIGCLAVALCIYYVARTEIDELFDFALAVPDIDLSGGVGAHPSNSDMEQDFVVQFHDDDGKLSYSSQLIDSLPRVPDLGYSTVTLPSGKWRVYRAYNHGHYIQVAQSLEERRVLAADAALRTIMPLLLLLPVLGLLIWFTVGRGLRPLTHVASAVRQRTASVLNPLPSANIPIEVQPLVLAINDLLIRLSRALHGLRSFVADAAHELRTPLTAIRIQSQLVERAENNDERALAYADFRQGLDRATHLVTQLLALARHEQEREHPAWQSLDLLALARSGVAELAPLAAARDIDIGISGESAPIQGEAEALGVMICNLVDNAIRYTPEHGRVDVIVRHADAQAILEISDNGPGIAVDERERIFDRFYRSPGTRTTGSGLGLAIVKNIVLQHGASIELEDAMPEHGLLVRVRFTKSV